jgi:phage gp46-like protein
MAQNIQLDPVKRDYIVQNGTPVPSDRVFESCYYPLLIPRNKWLYGEPGQGSLLYTLQNVKRTSSVEQQLSALAQDAVTTQVITPGKATAVQVQNNATNSTGSANTVGVVPAASQLSQQLNFVPV